nr:15669_t:CDS:2 [Entrophospora candida]
MKETNDENKIPMERGIGGSDGVVVVDHQEEVKEVDDLEKCGLLRGDKDDEL